MFSEGTMSCKFSWIGIKKLVVFSSETSPSIWFGKEQSFLEWPCVVSIWWFLWRLTIYKRTQRLSQWKIQIMTIIKATAAVTVSASRQRLWHGLKSQQWSSEGREINFCAAFVKLLPLFFEPWPWSELSEINGRTWVDLEFSSRLSARLTHEWTGFSLSVTRVKPSLTGCSWFEQRHGCCS